MSFSSLLLCLLALSPVAGADEPVTAKSAAPQHAEPPTDEDRSDDPEDTAAAEDADDTEDTPEAEEAEAPFVPRFPGQISPDFAHYDIEELYSAGKIDEGLRQAKERVAQTPDDPDLYWMIARFIFEQGEGFDRTDSRIDKVAHYAEMVDWSERGLALAPDDYRLRFSRGIANGRLGTTKGVLSSLRLARSVEADWLYTVSHGERYSSINGESMLPCDAQLALGIFYRLVPDRWIVQLLAGTRGSLTKSESFLKDAVACGPGRIGPMKELAITQICIGTSKKQPEMIESGQAILREILTMPAHHERDRIDHRHTRLLLEDTDIACGYSRDGQQDLDAAKLEEGHEAPEE